jgi:hypothetical protein
MRPTSLVALSRDRLAVRPQNPELLRLPVLTSASVIRKDEDLRHLSKDKDVSIYRQPDRRLLCRCWWFTRGVGPGGRAKIACAPRIADRTTGSRTGTREEKGSEEKPY